MLPIPKKVRVVLKKSSFLIEYHPTMGYNPVHTTNFDEVKKEAHVIPLTIVLT